MTRLSARRRAALALAAIAGLTLVLTGCAKKIASVDPGYTSPEGTLSPKARLVVTKDFPVPYLVYVDEKNDGFTPDDLPDPGNPYLTYASGPGAVVGTIMDSTNANAYQILRREANGGYRIAQDFSQHPAHKWLDTEWEGYSFADPTPSGFQPPTYLGRGVVSGVVTASSPLTNAAMASASDVADLKFDYQGQLNLADQQQGIKTFNPPDSVFNMRWTPVAGAAGYWISIYQFTGSSVEFLGSTLPAPVPLGKARYFLLAYVSAPATSYTIGDPADFLLTSRPVLNKQYYTLRITAVGPDGEILSYTLGDNLVLLPGAPKMVGTVSKNTWNITIPASIRLRPGPQAALAPRDRADSVRVLPARPGTALLRGTGLTP